MGGIGGSRCASKILVNNAEELRRSRDGLDWSRLFEGAGGIGGYERRRTTEIEFPRNLKRDASA